MNRKTKNILQYLDNSKALVLQGESKKMSVSEKGSLITNGQFF